MSQTRPLRPRLLRIFSRTPSRIPVLGFLILILMGTGLLMLPYATTRPLSFTDAFFTATSASCVTGLAVTDTAATFTLFGRSVLLGLVQIGGIGIMTLSTLILMAAGKRPRVQDRVLLQDTFTHSNEKSAAKIIKDVIWLTLAIEGIGACALFFRFLPDMPPLMAAGHAVFHSVSAFCNAGFALFPDSFIRYRGDVAVNLILAFLIISGGIGFLAISEIGNYCKEKDRRFSRISLHTKLVLTATFLLVITGTLTVFFMEARNTLAPLCLPEKLLASFFQSVTFRTAGFNTLAIGSFANETLFIALILMFIGACPGSCGGGIKTTTAATLFLLGISRLRGKEVPAAFRRTIPEASVDKATNLLLVSVFVVALGTLSLLISELGGVSHTETRGGFIELLFEAVSAFATVGLSTGVTPMLTIAGKWILILLMFTGRLGPLVLAVAISRRSDSRFRYAEESIMIG